MEQVTLGKLCAAGMVILEVACDHCPRRGRYRITRLIDRHGAALALPVLKGMLSADCPRHSNHSIYERCGAHFPGLAKLGGL